MARARSLTAEENERVCEAVRLLMKSSSSQAELASTMFLPDGKAISQPAVSQAVRGEQVGSTFARAVADRLGITLDELLSGERGKPDGAQRYDELQGWDEAAATVLEHQWAPPYAVEHAGRTVVAFPVQQLDEHFVRDLAMLWLKYAPLEERAAAEKADTLAARAARLAEEERVHAEVGRSGTAGIEVPREEAPAKRRGR